MLPERIRIPVRPVALVVIASIGLFALWFTTPTTAQDAPSKVGILERLDRAEKLIVDLREEQKKGEEKIKKGEEQIRELTTRLNDTEAGMRRLDLSFVRYDTKAKKIVAQFGNVESVKEGQGGHYIVKFTKPYPDSNGYTVVVTAEEQDKKVFVTARDKGEFSVNASTDSTFNLIVYGPPK